MAQVSEIELRDILLSNSSFGPNEISIILRKVCNDYSQYPNLKDVTGVLESQLERTPATSVRLGVCKEVHDVVVKGRPKAAGAIVVAGVT